MSDESRSFDPVFRGDTEVAMGTVKWFKPDQGLRVYPAGHRRQRRVRPYLGGREGRLHRPGRRREGDLRRRPEPWQGIGRKFEDPLSGYPVAGQPFGPRSHRRCRPQAHRFNPACFSFGFGGFGKLLLLRLALGRRWRSRPTKSGGPPLYEPSFKVQGDDTHNNSGFSVI